MIKYVLYQNNQELERFKKYNIFKDIIYFKSFIYNNQVFEYTLPNINNIYFKLYIDKLNKNQLNHQYSFLKILEDAIINNYDKIMILEYDVYFHKEFDDKYKKYNNLIKNNDIIHLGSSQHRWYNLITKEKIKIIKNNKNNMYYNNCQSLGTFAIILKKCIFNNFLNMIKINLMKYKIFPTDVLLSIISNSYKSIVLYPNIIICDISKSSIKERNQEYVLNIIRFKWKLNNYNIKL